MGRPKVTQRYRFSISRFLMASVKNASAALFLASSTRPLVPVSSRWHSTAWVGLPSAASLACTRFTSVSASPPSTVRPAGLLAMMMSSSSYTNTAAGVGRLSNWSSLKNRRMVSPFCTRVESGCFLPFSLILFSRRALFSRPRPKAGYWSIRYLSSRTGSRLFTCNSFIGSSTPDPTKSWRRLYPK